MRYLLGVIFLCFGIANVNAQSADKFIDSIKQSFYPDYQSQISSDKEWQLPVFHQELNGVAYIASYKFTNKKARKKVVIFSVYEFQNDFEATRFIDSIKTSLKANKAFLKKDFDYLSVSDKTVLRVDASCFFSEKEWKLLVENIENIANVFYKNIEKRLQVFCGGEALTYETSEINFKCFQTNAH